MRGRGVKPGKGWGKIAHMHNGIHKTWRFELTFSDAITSKRTKLCILWKVRRQKHATLSLKRKLLLISYTNSRKVALRKAFPSVLLRCHFACGNRFSKQLHVLIIAFDDPFLLCYNTKNRLLIVLPNSKKVCINQFISL